MDNNIILEVENSDTSNFADLKSPVVIDFFASWCGPCKMLSPIFEKVAGCFHDKVTFIKVDIDKNSELANKHEIMSVPTIVFMNNNTEILRKTGFIAEEEFISMIHKIFDLSD